MSLICFLLFWGKYSYVLSNCFSVNLTSKNHSINVIYWISELKFDVCTVLSNFFTLVTVNFKRCWGVLLWFWWLNFFPFWGVCFQDVLRLTLWIHYFHVIKGVFLWTESPAAVVAPPLSTRMTLSSSSLLSLRFHNSQASCGSLGSVHFSAVFPLFSGSDDFCYLPIGLLTVFCVLCSWPRGCKVCLLFIFFCFSSCTFRFGVSIWFFFQISLLHRDYHHIPIPFCCCYPWNIL